MMGIWQSYAGIYLYAAGITMLAGAGIPMLVVPMTWARWLRWEIPQAGRLATFLGRSLGITICAVAAYAIKAAGAPAAQPFFFEFLLWLLIAMLGVHIYGAIARAQPRTETAEIGLWVALILATLAFYPAG
jgi:hypothetical protein